jgi:hypothetical protein
MALSEDDLAKQQVQEAVWTWAGRFAALIAVFVLGVAAGFWQWGYGPEGAPHLRETISKVEADLLAAKNKNVDVEGQLTVTRTRLEQCQRSLSASRAAASGQ